MTKPTKKPAKKAVKRKARKAVRKSQKMREPKLTAPTLNYAPTDALALAARLRLARAREGEKVSVDLSPPKYGPFMRAVNRIYRAFKRAA